MELPVLGTVLAILLSSDKTLLTAFSGGKSLHPMYASLGNIAKNARSLAYLKAWPMIALLPVVRAEFFSNMRKVCTDNMMRCFRREILHASLKLILDQLIEGAKRYVKKYIFKTSYSIKVF